MFHQLFDEIMREAMNEATTPAQFISWRRWQRGVDETFEALQDELKNAQLDLEWFEGAINPSPNDETQFQSSGSLPFEIAWERARKLLCSDVETQISLNFEFENDGKSVEFRHFGWSGVSETQIDLTQFGLSDEAAHLEPQPYFHCDIPRLFGGQINRVKMPTVGEIKHRFALALTELLPDQPAEVERIVREFNINNDADGFEADDPFAVAL